MVRHTSTVVAVPSQVDTQLSPLGVAWSATALVACSLCMGSQDSPPSHGPIVLRCPGNGAETPSSGKQKGEIRTGTCKNRTRVKPLHTVFVRLLSATSPHPRPPGTGPTSAPTSAPPLSYIFYFQILGALSSTPFCFFVSETKFLFSRRPRTFLWLN